MDGYLQLCGLCGLAISLVVLIRCRVELRNTTLTTAASWSLISATVWGGLWAALQFLPIERAGLVDYCTYGAAILFLCSPVSVLGARRPTSRAWPWFVVLPMVIVLALPLAAGGQALSSPGRLHLETPVLVGFALVLVMSTGNYIGTRFTLPALLAIAATTLLVGSVSALVPEHIAQTYHFRPWSIVLMSSAVVLARLFWWRASRTGRIQGSPPRIERLNRLCSDFRNAFGIVWAKRIEERVNDVATKENWPFRLQGTSFVGSNADDPNPTGLDPAQCVARIEETMRWLLRRFCDPEWIDQRLGYGESPAGED